MCRVSQGGRSQAYDTICQRQRIAGGFVSAAINAFPILSINRTIDHYLGDILKTIGPCSCRINSIKSIYTEQSVGGDLSVW